MSLEYCIQRVLWESLESVLLANSKKYICDMANILGVPELELLQKVLPTSDSLRIIIQDTQAESNQCKAYVQYNKLTVFCRKPIAYGCEYCPCHRNKRMIIVEGTHPVQLHRLKDTYNTGQLWIGNNTLYNSTGDIVGKMKDGVIKIFVYD
jgi:hypothetical protein